MTSAARIIAGMRYLGEWQQRCEEAIRELSGLRGVLCVENLVDLVGTGGADRKVVWRRFSFPTLRNGELRIVGEATPQEIDACDRVLPGLIDEYAISRSTTWPSVRRFPSWSWRVNTTPRMNRL